jgi:hypothetical protein
MQAFFVESKSKMVDALQSVGFLNKYYGTGLDLKSSATNVEMAQYWMILTLIVTLSFL